MLPAITAEIDIAKVQAELEPVLVPARASDAGFKIFRDLFIFTDQRLKLEHIVGEIAAETGANGLSLSVWTAVRVFIRLVRSRRRSRGRVAAWSKCDRDASLAWGHQCDWQMPRRDPEFPRYRRGTSEAKRAIRLDDAGDKQTWADECALADVGTSLVPKSTGSLQLEKSAFASLSLGG
jgi:hypothetical protein